ncbi:MAG: ribonucleoside triphosphate reductase, partial [Erysipelotrichaceae bacterium]|nr:ribonucleoside triphosphate reductase [Erysipelotrichaceae bacterium]
MYQVVKRDGKVVEFDLSRISNAIRRAFDAAGKNYHPSVIDLLALKVTADFEDKIVEDKIGVEDIQDSCESVLSKAGYDDVAKAFILYRKQRETIRNIKNTTLDYKDVVDSYLKITDWRVKENSTVNYSVGGLILSNSGSITANYWLSEIYDKEIADAHRNCDLHLHDLSMLTGYCAGWSLKQLLQEGLGGVTGKITSSPAAHLSTLCNQMVNFLGIMQNEWAGAQAFSSFDTYLAPFVKVDNLSYKEVKQCVQSFVYGVNTPSRWGTQAPFTNVTLDWTVPDDMAELPAIVGGKEMNFKYKDCKAEMDMVNKAFLEIMIEGDANGRGFQYPIPTYSITKDFNWEESEN